jgi:vacuolar-type H+-ATPase subunit E/Vma4
MSQNQQHKTNEKITRAQHIECQEQHMNDARILLESKKHVVAECRSVERLLVCLCAEDVRHRGPLIAPKGP